MTTAAQRKITPQPGPFLELDAHLKNGSLQTTMPKPEIFKRVMNHTVVILHNAFDKAKLRQLRSAIFKWGLTVPPESTDASSQNYHVLNRGLSSKQKSVVLIRQYIFNHFDGLESDLSSGLREVFEPLARMLNELTGQQFSLDGPGTEVRFHPTVNHYPSGGGMFGPHVHPLEPQRVQLVLNMSERGVDFNEGGTGVEIGDTAYDCDDRANIGDLVIFRNDLRHWASMVDIEKAVNYGSEAGRWVAILPAYRHENLSRTY